LIDTWDTSVYLAVADPLIGSHVDELHSLISNNSSQGGHERRDIFLVDVCKVSRRV
jgi:hypothetical protein